MSFLKRLLPMKAKTWIELAKPDYHEGENVTGKVIIESHEYVKGEEVRVEIRVYEHYSEMVQVKPGDNWVWERQQRMDTKYSRDVRIHGPMDFGNDVQQFPFEVNVPVFRASHSDGSIQNSLKGVVAVNGRPDVTGEIDLSFLLPLPPGVAPASAAQQKVECDYCHNVFDVSLNKCPNCGAPPIIKATI